MHTFYAHLTDLLAFTNLSTNIEIKLTLDFLISIAACTWVVAGLEHLLLTPCATFVNGVNVGQDGTTIKKMFIIINLEHYLIISSSLPSLDPNPQRGPV